MRDLLIGLSKVVDGLVGDKLSVADSNGNRSVFIGRRTPPKPSYPYMVCDYVGEGDIGSSAAYSSFDGNTQTYGFNDRLRLRVAIYGNYEDDTLSIIKELKNRLYTQKGRDLMSLHMENAGLLNLTNPSFRDDLLNTDYEEFCSISMDFWVVSTIEDEVGAIETFENEGALYQVNYEQEEEPLTIDNNNTIDD